MLSSFDLAAPYTDSLGQASRRLGSETEDSGSDAHCQNLTGSSKGLVTVPNISKICANNSQSDSSNRSFPQEVSGSVHGTDSNLGYKRLHKQIPCKATGHLL